MVAGHVMRVKHPADCLSYRDASDFARQVDQKNPPERVLLDLEQTEDATTAALARLVVLRRQLRKRGGDLHLVHLHGKARHIWEVNRMDGLLPCERDSGA